MNAPATPSRTSARKRPAPLVEEEDPEVEQETEPEPEETTASGRPSRRRVKPKAFSSDWVTDDDTDARSAPAASSSPAKKANRGPTIVKIEAVGENGEAIPGQAEIGIEVNEDFDFDDSEDTANESLPNHDDEEAAQKTDR